MTAAEPLPIDARKQAAALAALELVEDGMQLGLGTGSTVEHLLGAIAALGLDVSGVPTSEATEAYCRELGIRLLHPSEVERLDLAIDGADELDRALTATKGGGGALLREKVVAAMAERFVAIATTDKLVDRLGDGFPLPIEVVPFAEAPVTRRLRDRGYEVRLRTAGEGPAVVTDNGNHLLDARMVGGIEDPAVEELWIGALPGVVECGLFVDLVDQALLADEQGRVLSLEPEPS
ncbi:MAG: ribose-5-phosphate isomerase RpiA [Nitriliruptor sp.]|nr:MAG: ribose-5-phosphate isomerase RpiA [Nitriliruptor sp.]